jgi:hypothetical protein
MGRFSGFSFTSAFRFLTIALLEDAADVVGESGISERAIKTEMHDDESKIRVHSFWDWERNTL